MREAHAVQWIEGGNFLEDFPAILFSCPAFSTESPTARLWTAGRPSGIRRIETSRTKQQSRVSSRETHPA